MKSIILLSLISAVFAKDISQFLEQKIEAENENEVGVAYQIYDNQPFIPMPDRNGVITGPNFRFQLTPGAMENQGMNMNQPQAMESMPVRFPGVNMPGMGMDMYPGYPGNMGMPNMGMNNMYPGYPGYYPSQGVSRTDACGCSSSCGMPCMWWSCIPCNPCPPCNQPTEIPTTTTQIITTTVTQTPLPTFPQEIPTAAPPSNPCPCQPVCPPCFPWFPCNPCNMCPCQTTPAPETTLPTQLPTTTLPPTTTTLVTATQEIPTESPPSGCNPCRPCMPCSIWWMCPPCNCNNGCQTSPPATVAPTLSPANNCPCVCAPCNPWAQNCPPCPSNCPCNN